MKKTVTLALLAATCIWGCKKDDQKSDQNSDITNSIFRVVSDANAKYQVQIVEVSASNATDTIQNITSNSPSNLTFGFTPRGVGSKITVKAASLTASSLNITVGYKAVRLGIDTIKKVGNGLTANFSYVIKN